MTAREALEFRRGDITLDPVRALDLRSPRSTLRDARLANASMVMTYDRERVVRRAGRIAPETQRVLDQALAMHLGLAAL